MKKLFKIVLAFIILIAIISFATPVVIKRYFNHHALELVGRKANLKSLTFNPITCTVTADNFIVYEAEDSSLFLGFRSFDLNINFSKLLTGQFQIEEVAIDSPYVNIINNEGYFNFTDLLPKQDSIEDKKASSSSDFEFEILNLRMAKGKVVYYEEDIDHRITMDDLSFKLPRFAYNSRSANMDIQFVIDETGILSMSNNFYPEESRFYSQIKLNNLNIDLAEPYTKDYINAMDIDGKANCDITIQGLFKNTTDIRMEGKAWFNEVEVKDTARLPLFTADYVGFELDRIDVFKKKFVIDEVMLKNFFMRFDRMDSTNNLMLAFAPLLEVDTTKNANDTLVVESTPLYYAVDTFIVSNSSIKYRDYTLDNYFEYDITNINALADNISSQNQKAKFSSTGLLNQQGRYNANLFMNPNDPLNFEVESEIKGFQMEDLSPFTLTYAGHSIFKGELVYYGNAIVKKGVMESQNEITIYNLQVGDKVSKNVLYEMPLKFAVFLLKDKDGVVNLDMPMNGNMNDPDFRIGPLVWQVIKQNMVKIVAAPGKILASQFGMDEEDLQYLPFEPQDTILLEQSIETLIKLQEITDNKEGLIVDLVYHSPNDMDVKNIALKKAKTDYVKAKLHPKTDTHLQKMINNTDDNDTHLITYLRKNMEDDTTQTDSLAIKWVGMEKLLSEARSLQIKRKEAVQNHFQQIDLAYLQKFKFSETFEPPKFEVDQSGFVINFEME